MTKGSETTAERIPAATTVPDLSQPAIGVVEASPNVFPIGVSGVSGCNGMHSLVPAGATLSERGSIASSGHMGK